MRLRRVCKSNNLSKRNENSQTGKQKNEINRVQRLLAQAFDCMLPQSEFAQRSKIQNNTEGAIVVGVSEAWAANLTFGAVYDTRKRQFTGEFGLDFDRLLLGV